MRQDERDDILLTLKTKVEHIEVNYVSRGEFIPVKTFVYGVVSASTLAIIGAIVKAFL